MDSGVRFTELMKQKVLWEEWYTRRFSRVNAGALSPEECKLLNMDPNKLVDPTLFTYLRHEATRGFADHSAAENSALMLSLHRHLKSVPARRYR